MCGILVLTMKSVFFEWNGYVSTLCGSSCVFLMLAVCVSCPEHRALETCVRQHCVPVNMVTMNGGKVGLVCGTELQEECERFSWCLR
jgi:hypothetical protein